MPLSELGVIEPDPRELAGFLKAMEFAALLKRVANEWDMSDTADIPVAKLDVVGRKPQASREDAVADAVAAPGAVVDRDAVLKAFDKTKYEAVTTPDALERWIARINEAGSVALATRASAVVETQAELLGIALAVAPGEACYVPIAHGSGGGLDFGDSKPQQLSREFVIKKLRPLLEDEAEIGRAHV